MTITYEVRRGSHVLTKKDTAAEALSHAQVFSHFPGQLDVYGVEHREWKVTDASGLPATDGAVILQTGKRAAP